MLPSGAETIYNHVFVGCTALASIDTSKCTGLKKIGNYAFENTGLTSFDFTPFASSLETLEQGVFNNCKKLTTVTGFEKLDNITEIGSAMFQSYPLTSISLPENITTIGSNAFKGHKSTQAELRIPNGVTVIGDHAFARAENGGEGARIYLPAKLTTISPSYTFERWRFAEMYIPSGVTAIPYGFTNGGYEKGVVFYYTGAENGLTIDSNNNKPMTTATWISAVDFTGKSDSCNYIVYGYNTCDAFYNGVHTVDNPEYQFTSFTENTYLAGVCKNCELEKIIETYGPIVVISGASYSDNDIMYNYSVNKTAIEKYIASGRTLSFGVVVALGDVTSPLNADGTLADGVGGYASNLTDRGNDLYEIAVKGIPAEHLATSLVCCGYITDGTTLHYMGATALESAATPVTLEALIALTPAETKEEY